MEQQRLREVTQNILDEPIPERVQILAHLFKRLKGLNRNPLRGGFAMKKAMCISQMTESH